MVGDRDVGGRWGGKKSESREGRSCRDEAEVGKEEKGRNGKRGLFLRRSASKMLWWRLISPLQCIKRNDNKPQSAANRDTFNAPQLQQGRNAPAFSRSTHADSSPALPPNPRFALHFRWWRVERNILGDSSHFSEDVGSPTFRLTKVCRGPRPRVGECRLLSDPWLRLLNYLSICF
jgi:hypothetical protein